MKVHPNTTTTEASKLGMHRDSHVISKFKPKIRIIHIRAPEIIKADVANFRELVQRLTGKPCNSKSDKEKTSSSTPTKQLKTLSSEPSSTPTKQLKTLSPEPSQSTIESETTMHSFQNGNRMKKESEEIWGIENSNGFIGGFGDMDGFIQDLSEFPLLPLKSSHFNIFGEMPLFQ